MALSISISEGNCFIVFLMESQSKHKSLILSLIEQATMHTSFKQSPKFEMLKVNPFLLLQNKCGST